MGLRRHWSDDPDGRRAPLARPGFWLGLVLSLAIHGLALWYFLPRIPLLSAGPDAAPSQQTALSLRLAEPERTANATPPPAPEPPARTVARAAPRTPRPPVLTAPPNVSSPVTVYEPPPAPPAPPEPPPPERPVVTLPQVPIEGDLQAYIAARRGARGETGVSRSAAEEETARRDRIVAANLASVASANLGAAPKNGGGLFQITRMSSDEAEFTFYGWNKDVKRRMSQHYEVARGANSDINIAIVRRIIAIIREYEQADFHWDSRRLGRDIVLSARLEDTAELEATLLREFFTETRGVR